MSRSRVILAAIVVVLAAFAAGAVAQDRIFGWTLYHDTVLPEHTCGAAGLAGPAQPFYYDHQARLFYTCTDGRVIMRTFFNPQDNVTDTYNVKIVGETPGRPTIYCPSGFVETQDGKGCVPPSHPLAKH
jgi:hypothetical protein